MKIKLPTLGDVIHQDIFTRLRLPMMSSPERKHSGPLSLWMHTEDIECMQQCHKGSMPIPRAEVQDTGVPPVRVNGREYYNMNDIRPFKSIFELSKQTTHINLVNRKHFPLRAQFILIQHANTHGLYSQVWTTRDMIRRIFRKSVVVKENAVPAEVPFCDIADGMKDVHLISLEERIQKYGIVEFFNVDQTSNPREILDFFHRGGMRSLVNHRTFPPRLQYILYKAAKSNGFTSNQWISPRQLQYGKYQDIKVCKGQFPVTTERKFSDKVYIIRLYNVNQLILRTSNQSTERNIFGGQYKARGIAEPLRSFAKSRGFTCQYWADHHQLDMLKTTLVLLPDEQGVHVKSATPGGNRTYYNLQQMENYDSVRNFVEGLTFQDIEKLLDETVAESKEIGDDWGFS
ncbi:mitochondrial RNA binding protein [Perkinsela sp. CCAP 1560/4]|nr:mitochondrial RNA binding protein [Perkinsela sp. CCAP 1560/4]|eukprot:KNH07437.1 mitochondrial RNA binding protein [Perkinsela sp. CCAP 1560/4]